MALLNFFCSWIGAPITQCGKTRNLLSLMQFFVKSTCYLVTVSVKTLLLRNFRQKKCERKFLHFPHSAAPKILSESSKILLFPRHLSNKSNQSRSFSLVNYFSSNWHEFLSYHKKDPKITIIVLTKIVENHAEKIFREINYSVTKCCFHEIFVK